MTDPQGGGFDYPEDRLRAARVAAQYLRNDNDALRRQIKAARATIVKLGEELLKAHAEIAQLKDGQSP